MNGTIRTIALGAVILACCLLGMPLAAFAGENSSFYYYQGRKVFLDPSPDQFSVGLREGEILPREDALQLPSGAVRASSRALSALLHQVSLTEEGGSTPAAPGRSEMRQEFGRRRPTIDSTPQAPGGTEAKALPAEKQARMAALRSEALAFYRDSPAVAFAYGALINPKTGRLLYPTDRIVIKVQAGMGEREVSALLPPSVQMLRPMRNSKSQYLLRLGAPKTDEPLAVAAALKENYRWIEWAEPDFVQQWRLNVAPNDALYGDQWHLKNKGQGTPAGIAGADARMEGAWDIATGGGNIVIAVIDDGMQLAHPDLFNRIFTNPVDNTVDGVDDDGNGYIDDIIGWDFFQNDNNPSPVPTAPSHGTAVAGVAAAQGKGPPDPANPGFSQGITGACWNCPILTVRIADNVTFAINSAIADAIRYAGQFADVLNNSWGGGASSPVIDSAIQDVSTNGRGGKGAPVLFASGNAASGYLTFTLTGITDGNWQFTWSYIKDPAGHAGFDTVWLDDVVFPDGSVEEFEGCSAIPAGWSNAGAAIWQAVNDETRASSARGGNCAVRAGAIGDAQISSISVTKSFSGLSGPGGELVYSAWVSSEKANTADGTGALEVDNDGTPGNPGNTICKDGVALFVTDLITSATFGPFFFFCGTFSNQGVALQDGVVSYPASLPETIAVGAATNFDRRSDYSQWGPELDFVAHSSGGSLGITTTDLVGTAGYNTNTSANGGDHTSTFGGTSSATPLAAGIVGLLLTNQPTLTATQVRTLLRDATRRIGPVAYTTLGRNDNYGYGALDATQVIAGPDNTPPATSASPAGGTYASAQSVALSCNDGAGGTGCTATYYTTDGSTPTVADVYGGPINVSADMTLKFFSLDDAGNAETVRTEPYVITGSGSAGGGCFIGMTASGSHLAPHLGSLREFRDRYLLTHQPGRALVRWYYRVSPWLVEMIGRDEALKRAARLALTPVVYGFAYPLLPLAAAVLVITVAVYRRRRNGGRAA